MLYQGRRQGDRRDGFLPTDQLTTVAGKQASELDLSIPQFEILSRFRSD